MSKKKDKAEEAETEVVVVPEAEVTVTSEPVEVVELPKVVKTDKSVKFHENTVIKGNTTFAF